MEGVLRKLQDRIQQNFHLKKVGGGSKYFSGARRGEGVELAADLNSTDKDRQKNAVKRIIANMTLGRDVSQMFVDVVKLGQTLNIELKKLVYLYVLNTAKLQPEKALLAVNTFLQDSAHQSPIIRALSIRTMMCMRTEGVTEYTIEPLRRAISDPDPYVRKTAAIGIGKLFHLSRNLFEEQGFSSELVQLLKDPFPIVCSNAAAILLEVIQFSSQKLSITNKLAHILLNALPEASEWGQVYLLDVLATYANKATEDEMEAFLSRVSPRLSHGNPAVVMGAVKVMATAAGRFPDDDRVTPYFTRINSALLALARSDPGTQFLVCKNIHILLKMFPMLLVENVDAFYIRFNDPPYVKMEKLRLLLKLTSPSNAGLMVRELGEYLSEVDLTFVKEVLSSLVVLAIKVEEVAPRCAELIMSVLKTRPELLPQVITASKNISRKYPMLLQLDDLITQYSAGEVNVEEAKVSLVWMLGEYCDHTASGKAILLEYTRNLMDQECSVQHSLLTAIVKVFLRDPAGMESTLNGILETLTSRSQDPDLRDRAYGYWRLLSRGIGVEKMKQIVHGQKPPMNVENSAFSESMSLADLKSSINTAAAVYGRSSLSFMGTYGLCKKRAEDSDYSDSDEEENAAPAGAPSTAAATVPSSAASTSVTADNPLDDLFGAGEEAAVSSPTSRALPTTLPPQVLAASHQTGGVAIHASFSAAAGLSPVLRLGLVHRGSTPISDLVMQINNNSLGFLPSAPLAKLLPTVSPGETRVIDMPLQVQRTHLQKDRHTLEIAITGKGLQLQRFTLAPAIGEYLTKSQIPSDAAVDELNAQEEVQVGLPGLGSLLVSSSKLDRVLDSANILFLSYRRNGQVSIYYYFCKTFIGDEMMLRLQVDPDNPESSNLIARGPNPGAHIQLARHVISMALKPAETTQADPFALPAAPTSAPLDLFGTASPAASSAKPADSLAALMGQTAASASAPSAPAPSKTAAVDPFAGLF